MSGQRWNSNLHAFDLMLQSVPDGLQRGIDVGCGEGETARRLRARVPTVVGLDPDRHSIAAARAYGDDIEYRVGRIGDGDLGAASFDVVTAVAVLHHMEQVSALSQLARLVRPGGLLLVVGLARSGSVSDFFRDAYDSVAIRRHTVTKRVWETPAPKVWPPPLTYAETRAASLLALPDARYERLPYFRYGLTWRAPAL